MWLAATGGLWAGNGMTRFMFYGDHTGPCMEVKLQGGWWSVRRREAVAAWVVVVGTGGEKCQVQSILWSSSQENLLMDWMWGVREREEQGKTSSPFPSLSYEAPAGCLLEPLSPSTILTHLSSFPSQNVLWLHSGWILQCLLSITNSLSVPSFGGDCWVLN